MARVGCCFARLRQIRISLGKDIPLHEADVVIGADNRWARVVAPTADAGQPTQIADRKPRWVACIGKGLASRRYCNELRRCYLADVAAPTCGQGISHLQKAARTCGRAAKNLAASEMAFALLYQCSRRPGVAILHPTLLFGRERTTKTRRSQDRPAWQQPALPRRCLTMSTR